MGQGATQRQSRLKYSGRSFAQRKRLRMTVQLHSAAFLPHFCLKSCAILPRNPDLTASDCRLSCLIPARIYWRCASFFIGAEKIAVLWKSSRIRFKAFGRVGWRFTRPRRRKCVSGRLKAENGHSTFLRYRLFCLFREQRSWVTQNMFCRFASQSAGVVREVKVACGIEGVWREGSSR